MGKCAVDFGEYLTAVILVEHYGRNFAARLPTNIYLMISGSPVWYK